ncbi:MAG: hypothetical protein WBR35_24360 [Anaerolineae bacterium]
MTASEREAHILGMIDELTGEIGAYLAQFADEDQASALPLAMMRLQGRMRLAWTGFVDREIDNSEVWRMLP